MRTWRCGGRSRRPSQAALGLSWLPEYTARMLPNTQLLEIQVIDTDPARAQAVANEVANQLIQQTPAEDRDLQQRRRYLNRELQETEIVMDETKAEIQRLRDQMAVMFSARQIADTQSQIAALQQKLNSYQNDLPDDAWNSSRAASTPCSSWRPADLPTVPVGPTRG